MVPTPNEGTKANVHATVNLDTANERDRFARPTALSWKTGTGAGVVTYHWTASLPQAAQLPRAPDKSSDIQWMLCVRRGLFVFPVSSILGSQCHILSMKRFACNCSNMTPIIQESTGMVRVSPWMLIDLP